MYNLISKEEVELLLRKRREQIVVECLGYLYQLRKVRSESILSEYFGEFNKALKFKPPQITQ